MAPMTVKEQEARGEVTGEKRLFFRSVPVFDTLSRVCWKGFLVAGGAVRGSLGAA
jgi:hypothetical protein